MTSQTNDVFCKGRANDTFCIGRTNDAFCISRTNDRLDKCCLFSLGWINVDPNIGRTNVNIGRRTHIANNLRRSHKTCSVQIFAHTKITRVCYKNNLIVIF